MPRSNGTGPLGQGPGTGWGMGPCGAGLRMGWGCRGAYGMGRRRFVSPVNELSALESEENLLMEELEIIKAEKAALKTQK